jgi:hypothetical protein
MDAAEARGTARDGAPYCGHESNMHCYVGLSLGPFLTVGTKEVDRLLISSVFTPRPTQSLS